jgi:predicted nicotinamide N-methyase
VSTPGPIIDHTAFVQAHTRPLHVPHAPEISLYLAEEATPLWQKTEDELGEIGLAPPFWAFAWAGGQALARYILDNPESVRGRRVLDFASGSGLVAIAAAKAEAGSVEACDIDPFACAAMALNAGLNRITLQPRCAELIGQDEGWDVVLAGDIAYERDTAARVFAWLRALALRGATVLVGDPGRTYLPTEGLVLLATYSVPVTRELEDNDIKRTQVFAVTGTQVFAVAAPTV